MLKVQEYLKTHTLLQLEEELGIGHKISTDGRVILNYDQLDSPKFNPIVEECRGLVLSAYDFSLIARSFPRFYNLSENPHQVFDFTNFFCQEKVDGSLILVYWWNDKWNVNTRNSFGIDVLEFVNKSWEQLVKELLPLDNMLKYYTYVFEFTSPYNQVVVYYDVPQVTLLTMFYGERELSYIEVADYCITALKDIVKCVKTTHFSEFDTVEKLKKTYPEGVVLRDLYRNRIKWKNEDYVLKHHLFSNQNIFIPKYLVPALLKEQSELLSTIYNPQFKKYMADVSDYLNSLKAASIAVYDEVKGIESQKEFALEVLKRSEIPSLLFETRKKNSTIEKEFPLQVRKLIDLVDKNVHFESN